MYKMSICDYCSKELSSKQALQRHKNICKKIKEVQEKQLQEQTQRQQYEREIQIQLQIQREKYEREIQIQKEQYENQIEELKSELSDYKNQIFEIAKQPKQIYNTTQHHNNTQTNNNQTNNIQNNHYNQYIDYLAPMTLTTEEVKDKLDQIDHKKFFEDGTEGILKFVKSLLQKDDKHMIMCVDMSRDKFIYFKDNNVVVDHELRDTHALFNVPIRNRIITYYLENDTDKNYKIYKNMEHYTNTINKKNEFKAYFDKMNILNGIKNQSIEED